jgi:voltage-gated potassium channel
MDSVKTGWKENLHSIIFETESRPGLVFDVGLLISIFVSVLFVILESVESIENRFGLFLKGGEWFFTILFTIEFILRIIAVKRPVKYLLSFYGIIDLLSILPTYMSGLITGSHYLIIIRSLRLLRVFRILKLMRYLGEASLLTKALRASRYKITVFLGAVLILASILGTLMYLIEGPENGFTSIPQGIYWAVVTLTTVGYGDIYPSTIPGKFISTIAMILGYGIIAVPTGIVSVELSRVRDEAVGRSCPSCGAEGHDNDADFCKYCGAEL